MTAALLLNSDLKVAAWQLQCIDLIAHEIKYIYLPSLKKESANAAVRRLQLKNTLYYLLNLKSIRQSKAKVRESILQNAEIRRIEYTLTPKGWAEIDRKSINRILNDSPEYIYKCGLSLLSIPPELDSVPIISHHHGDPGKYRGRPAGFYEILNDETAVGQIVQVLSNKLDAGRILAYGESKIYAWSYKKTLKDAYAISPYIFRNALKILRENKEVSIDVDGKNHRLPENRIVARFISRLFIEKLRRLFYGIFYEKCWNIAIAKNPLAGTQDPLALLTYARSRPQGDKLVAIDRKYSFYADSFLLDNNVLVEGLRRFDGVGELIELDSTNLKVLKIIRPDYSRQRHLSYPYVFKMDSHVYIYPDSAEYDKPFLLRKEKAFPGEFKTLEIGGPLFASGITDPSVIYFQGKYYLFGNLRGESSILRLWVGDDPAFGNAFEHPCSPVRMGPRGSRSGGKIFANHNQIYRIAQDFSRGYGDGLLVYRVSTLTPALFEERLAQEINFDHPMHGPHTFDATDQLMCWDYYYESFSLFAGYRRVLARLKSKLQNF